MITTQADVINADLLSLLSADSIKPIIMKPSNPTEFHDEVSWHLLPSQLPASG